MTELLVRPDAHPEVSSVNGRIESYKVAGATWADLRAGQDFYSSYCTNYHHIEIQSDAVEYKCEYINQSTYKELSDQYSKLGAKLGKLMATADKWCTKYPV